MQKVSQRSLAMKRKNSQRTLAMLVVYVVILPIAIALCGFLLDWW